MLVGYSNLVVVRRLWKFNIHIPCCSSSICNSFLLPCALEIFAVFFMFSNILWLALLLIHVTLINLWFNARFMPRMLYIHEMLHNGVHKSFSLCPTNFFISVVAPIAIGTHFCYLNAWDLNAMIIMTFSTLW